MKLNKVKPNLVLCVLLSFAMIFNISFVFAPSLTSARIAFFIIIVLSYNKIFYCLRNESKFYISRCFFYILCCSFLFSVVQFLLSSGDSTQVSRLLYFFLFSIVGAIGISSLLDFDINKVSKAIVYAIFFQSIFIFVDYNSVLFHSFVTHKLVQPENYKEDWIRAVGLTNGGGSSLSMILFSGFVVCLYLLNDTKQWREKSLYVFMAVSIMGSTVLTGRTGLVLEILFLLTFPLYNRSFNFARILKSYLSLFLFISLFLYLLDNYLLNIMLDANDKFEFLLLWLEEIGEFGSGGTVNALKEMNVPPVSLDTILGTGYVKTSEGFNASGSDIGYVQTYYSLGLIFTVLFYLSLFSYLSWNFYKYFGKKYFFWQTLVILIFFAEYKEPFIFKYSLIFVVFTVLTCKFRNFSSSTKNYNV